ncbi:MAG: rod shape-determining protein MreC [Saprospiraceae bacterium]|nr:rod shape-determining protein MreC [Saprospiraceae bacterium]
MQNLLLFFVRFGGVVLFVILECICFFLIVKNNKKQESIYLNSSNLFSGAIYSRFDRVVRYFYLDEISDSVMVENAKLYQQLTFLKSLDTIPTLDTLFGDSIRFHYELIPTRIINNIENSSENSMTLDKGTKAGIHSGMGVISNKGIIGIVRNVSENYSQVMTILNTHSSISTSIKRNNYFGSLVWNRIDARYMRMDALPKHADLKIGDTIQTSGYSTIFPKGIFVGVVDSFWIEPGTGLYSANVRTMQDLMNLQYAYVIKNFRESELSKLEEMNDMNKK